MTSPAVAKPRRCHWTLDERKEWLTLFEQSGMALSEFCRANDFSEATLSLWRRQAREPEERMDGRTTLPHWPAKYLLFPVIGR